jgi:hypothetical protein
MYSSTSGTRILADLVRPNPAAWLRQFTMSLPNWVMTSTSGLAAFACESADEKSVVLSGVITFLLLAPLASMIAVMLSWTL